MAGNQRKAGALLSYGYIAANAIVVLLYQPLLMRLLGQSEFGLYSLMTSIAGYLSVLDLGLGNAVVVFTAKYRAIGDFEGERRLHGLMCRTLGIIGAAVTLIGVLLSFNLPLFFSSSLTAAELERGKILMLILSLNMGLTIMLSVYSNIVTAYEEFIFAKVLSIAKTLLAPLIMVPVLLLGGKSVILVAVISVVNIACLAANRVFCEKKLGINADYMGTGGIGLREIAVFSVFIFTAELVDKINWNIDQFIIGIIRGTDEVAVYSYATNFNQMFLLLSATVAGVIQPKITSLVAKNCSKDELSLELVKYSRFQLYPMLLLTAGFALLGHDFVLLHGGAGYGAAYFIVLILFIGELVPLTQSVALAAIKAQNNIKFWAITTLLTAIVNIIITIPLTYALGSIGSALGTGITFALANGVIMNFYYNKAANISIARYWINLAKMILGFAPSVAITWVVKFVLHLGVIPEFLICGSVFVVLYVISAYLFVMNVYEKALLAKVLKRK